MQETRPQPAARGGLRNLELTPDAPDSPLGDTFTFWFRPSVVRESYRAVYGDLTVLGMSHSYRTYEYTDNVSFSFGLYVNRTMLLQDQAVTNAAGGRSWRALSAYIQQGKRFLEALHYAPAIPGGLPGIGTAPPACLLSLPGICLIRCRVTSVDFTIEECDHTGDIKELRAQLTVEEAPVSRITMQDVLTRGAFRTWGGR